MDAKHTPGPWTAVSQTFQNGQTGDRGVHWWVVGPAGHALPMAAGRNMAEADTVRANALLLAAAPDLIEACEVALGHVTAILMGRTPDHSPGVVGTVLAAAVKKATGEGT